MAAKKGADSIMDSKKKALSLAMGQIEKNHGKGAIMLLGEKKDANIEAIPTGIPSIDSVLGIGGMPRGRIVEIYGGESSGKTTLAMHVMAQAQKLGGIAAIVDAEHAFDPRYAKKLGLNIDELVVSQPDSGEQALDITENLVRSGAVDIVVIDSVAALVPKAEIEGEMGDSNIALQARLMSQALRKLTSSVSKSKTCIIFINQLRMKVGVFFGNPEVTSGGNALKFYASIRVDLRKKAQTLKKADNILGDTITVKIIKNKLAPPFKSTQVDLVYGEGFSAINDTFNLAVEANFIEKSGTWYAYKGERLGQGKDNAIEFLKSNKTFLDEIEKGVRDFLNVAGDEILEKVVEPEEEDVEIDEGDAKI